MAFMFLQTLSNPQNIHYQSSKNQEEQTFTSKLPQIACTDRNRQHKICRILNLINLVISNFIDSFYFTVGLCYLTTLKSIDLSLKTTLTYKVKEFINLIFLIMELQWLALIIPGSYIAISLFFLIFPNILYKRMKYAYEPFNHLIDSDKLFCIGHRGGAWEGPENCMETFKKFDHLQHMFELDVCLTKDQRLVVHHDATLGRLTGKALLIQETNFADLPSYMNVIEAFGGQKVQTTNNKIPLLEDIFSQFPQKPMNIELKTPSDQAIREYARIVKKYNRQHITIWGVAGGKNQQLRQSAPNVVNFYSAGEILKIYLLFLTGLLPFVCIRQGVVDIPLATESFKKMVIKFAGDSCLKKSLLWVLYQVVNCFNFFSRLWIPHLKKRGILTFYFILNEEEDFETAVSIGCSGIMTDVPMRLNKYLKEKGLFYQDEDSI